MNHPYQFREWVRTVPAQENWLKGEPSLHEMLADPIVRLVMHRDNLGPADVWAAVERGRIALHGQELDSRNVA